MGVGRGRGSPTFGSKITELPEKGVKITFTVQTL